MPNEKYIEFEEIDSDLFRGLVEDDHHNQLLAALNKFTIAIANSNKNEDVVKSIERYNQEIRNMVDKLSKTSPPKLPDVRVETNQDMVVTSIEKLAEKLIEKLEENTKEIKLLRESNQVRPLKWVFTLDKDRYGNIDSIIAEAK